MFKRSFKNMLLFPGPQLRHGLLFLGVSTVVHLGLTIVAVFIIDAWMAGRQGIGDLPFWKIALGIGSLYGGFLIFVFLFGLYISHKWLGPLIAIEKFLASMAQGDYSERLHLRKSDISHMKRIGDLLNLLAERLQKSNQKSG